LDRFELGELAAKAIAEKVTAKPAKEIPIELAAKVEFDPASGTVNIIGTLNADEEAHLLKECFEKKEDKEKIVAAVQRVRVKVETAKSPSERGEIFSVPVLAVKQGNFLEQFEKTHLDGMGWTLKGCDAALSEGEFSLTSETSQTSEVDVSEAGKLEARFMPELEKQMTVKDRSESKR
jgi:type III restriction enzyme